MMVTVVIRGVFLDSRWVLGFTTDSWINEGCWDSQLSLAEKLGLPMNSSMARSHYHNFGFCDPCMGAHYEKLSFSLETPWFATITSIRRPPKGLQGV